MKKSMDLGGFKVYGTSDQIDPVLSTHIYIYTRICIGIGIGVGIGVGSGPRPLLPRQRPPGARRGAAAGAGAAHAARRGEARCFIHVGEIQYVLLNAIVLTH